MNFVLVISFAGNANRWRRRRAGGFTCDGDAKTASGTLAPPNPAVRGKLCARDAWETSRCRALFRNLGDDQVQQLERSALSGLDRRAFRRGQIDARAL